MSESSNSMFFEGVEKLLEVWFTRRDGKISNCELRKIPRSRLELICQEAKCAIVSTTSSDDLDAYLLSESSMFVSRRRFILKTCGNTTPLKTLPILIELAKEFAGYDLIEDLYYSRKNFKRPELQLAPYTSFEEEGELLRKYFSGGRAYCMGSLNGEDCWYLYTVSPGKPRRQPLMMKQNLPQNRVGKHGNEPDQTLEILMTKLTPEKMKVFYKESCTTGSEATEKSGIDKLIPGMIIDDYMFDPCGYSMNGASRNTPANQKGDGAYMTIHITPEPDFSYVSFETNVYQNNYKDLINRVVKIFGPDQFIVTFFSNQKKNSLVDDEDPTASVPLYPDYNIEDLQLCCLPGYDITYALYNRFPS